jgi:tetratricopeptide (TPR) repeat protein
MNNLALKYSELGRHQDALAMQQKTLEFRRRVLPENHPDIGATSCFGLLIEVEVDALSALGDAMSNLAVTYCHLGRHQDALAMGERTLELWRRALPENHPRLGISCLNLGYNFVIAGDLLRALHFAREALRILQATMPPSHPHVKQAQELALLCEGNATRRL